MLMLRPKRRATFCHEFYIFSALLFCVCSSRRPVTSAVHLFFLRLTRDHHIVLFWRQWKFHIILRIYRTCMRIVCAQKKNSRRILSLAMGGGIMFQCTIFGVYLISTWPTAVFKLKFLDRQKKRLRINHASVMDFFLVVCSGGGVSHRGHRGHETLSLDFFLFKTHKQCISFRLLSTANVHQPHKRQLQWPLWCVSFVSTACSVQRLNSPLYHTAVSRI